LKLTQCRLAWISHQREKKGLKKEGEHNQRFFLSLVSLVLKMIRLLKEGERASNPIPLVDHLATISGRLSGHHHPINSMLVGVQVAKVSP